MVGKLVPPNEIMFLESALPGGAWVLPSLVCALLISLEQLLFPQTLFAQLFSMYWCLSPSFGAQLFIYGKN